MTDGARSCDESCDICHVTLIILGYAWVLAMPTGVVVRHEVLYAIFRVRVSILSLSCVHLS